MSSKPGHVAQHGINIHLLLVQLVRLHQCAQLRVWNLLPVTEQVRVVTEYHNNFQPPFAGTLMALVTL